MSSVVRKPTSRERQNLTIRGTVQGVGFRPHAYRLARELNLSGWILNTPEGVQLEIEGPHETVHTFTKRLENERPALSQIVSIKSIQKPPYSTTPFKIRSSAQSGKKAALILPDIATCPECLSEILDPQNRRYLYPFTNCTHCGPRFSIINKIPYDRPNTTMYRFKLCSECQSEYDNPLDRRFHAQPIACPQCGPQLSFALPLPYQHQGNPSEIDQATPHGALAHAIETLRSGKILALKGLGGFQLLVDARNARAVKRLRNRKHRSQKPFATLFPSLEQVRTCCDLSLQEANLLTSPQAPIVLLKKIHDDLPEVAPGNPELGIMLPCTPLHHLIMRELKFPLVATSGNISEEPICFENRQALRQLEKVADAFLLHNRPIARPIDDSVVRCIHGKPQILRRARGFAPLPIKTKTPTKPLLAVGGHLKNAVAIAAHDQVFLSQHIGNLETEESRRAFVNATKDLPRLYDAPPALVLHDAHPDYHSSQHAKSLGTLSKPVQHHLAHVYACMAEHQLSPPVLGVSWDGTGYGSDGTVWGGEAFLVTNDYTKRVASLLPFQLPGGEKAVKEPRRSALGLLHKASKLQAASSLGFAPTDLQLLRQALEKTINSPSSSSMGRLFDAVSALLQIRLVSTYEGQAAMELEWAARIGSTQRGYPLDLIPPEDETHPHRIDWRPLFAAILDEISNRAPTETIARKFHNSLATLAVKLAQNAGCKQVVLSGGCFQNRLLSQLTVRNLRKSGFTPYWHQKVPPNDGGIALGQIASTQYPELTT